MKTHFLVLCSILFFGLACSKEKTDNSGPSTPEVFSVDEHYILKDGQPFPVKGVVYVPGYPGFLPWEIEGSTTLKPKLQTSIRKDLANIKAMNANVVRLWGAPQYCYQALKDLGGLYFLQTIWIDSEAADLQDLNFKRNTKTYIKQVIDRIYTVFEDPPVVAYILGNELSAKSILATNAAHPEINSFSGNHFQVDGINAAQAFLAEMSDYARSYEYETYGRKTLLTYANDIRTLPIFDTPFLDFISHNAYSYAVPYYRPQTKPGSSSGTLFQGWLEKVKSRNPHMPLLITETGLSVSPNAPQVGPPDYGYGGNTETQQADGLLQNLNDIESTGLPLAGLSIHEYLDAWWKFGLQDSYSQDPNDIEEWFGLVRLKDSANWYSTEFRPSYYALQARW